ncbi:MAG: 4-(cytidine 5'-diphospho)-2-C-methyl-D-erythritol kinase [Ferruginibacter sp.]
MIVFPNCKINLGLIVRGKRADGYHDIETVFYPVQVKDVLEIISLPGNPADAPTTTFTHSGLPVDGDEMDNLCIKAYQLLKKDFPQVPSIKMHLHKAIPMGAGLGGGSADAAFTLITLNEKYALNLTVEQLLLYALQLGSDCPFFIINNPCIATGRGETLNPVAVSLAGYQLVLINPGIHINTGWAFSQITIDPDTFAAGTIANQSLQAIISQPVSEWKNELKNDFENPVFKRYPEIKAIKDLLYETGAVYASMSGSGSSVYGIYKDNIQPTFNFPPKYFVRRILL